MSLKLLANFFSSVNLTSLSALALLLLAFSAFCRCWLAKLLKEFKTSRSTVEVALSVLSFGSTELLRESNAEAELMVAILSTDFDAWVLESEGGVEGFPSARLPSAVLSCEDFRLSVLATTPFRMESVEPCGLGSNEACCFFAGAFSCDEMIAGSTGAPLTDASPVGARLAGGVYLLPPPDSGGKSWRRTPLYL